MPIFVGAASSSFAKGDGGVGVTKVTTSERDAISNPQAGQLVYNTSTSTLQIYNGTTWASVYEPPMSGDGGNQANGIEPGNGYKYHTFTNSGSITFSGAAGNVQVLVVAGGGGGGANNGGGTDGGGGGGGGGVALTNGATIPITPGTYNITVGGGGAGGNAPGNENNNPTCRSKNAPFGGNSGQNGGNSVFGASSPNAIKITAIGGGGGGSGPNAGNQDCGGSGGAAGSGGSPFSPGANGTQPSANGSFNSGSLSQYGNPGGDSPATPEYRGAGGGGAGGGGSNGSSSGPGQGGPGIQLPSDWAAPTIGYPGLNPFSRYYGAGGSGGRQGGGPSPISGGTGGGGQGHSSNSGPNPGAANGGGGAGGTGNPTPSGRDDGSPGGKGLVVIRYTV